MTNHFFRFVILVVLFSSFQARADELDIQQEMLKVFWLKNNGQAPLPGAQPGEYCAQNGDIGNSVPFARLFGCKYTISNIRAIGVDTHYSEVKSAPIPTTILKEVRPYANCRDVPLNINDTITLNYSEGITIVRSTTTTRDSNTSNAQSISIPISGITFGVNKTEQVSSSTQENQTYNELKTTDRTDNRQINLTVEPKRIVFVTLEKFIKNSYIEFNGIVKLEGDMIWEGIRRPSGDIASPHPFNMGKWTSFVPPDSQTIKLRGEIWNAKAETTTRTDSEQSIPEGSNFCAQPQTNAYKNFKPFYASNTNGVLTRTSLYNGMLIKTSDSVGNVRVRAKSQGPGMCGTNITSGLGSSSILASPFSWSAWSTLFSHAGSVSTTVSTSVICDTGALFEIEYWK